MLDIRDEDLEYALDETAELGEDFTSIRAWEAELIKNSPEFWTYLDKEIVAAAALRRGKENKSEVTHPRYIMTLVFATVYSARKWTLPRLRVGDARRLHASCKGIPSAEEVIETMDRMHAGWCLTMKEYMQGYDDDPYPNYIIFLLTKTLFDALRAEKKDHDPAKFTAVVPSARGRLPPDKKKPARASGDNVDKESEASSSPITFADIGGQQKVKLEVMKLAAALNNPERYKRWGTRPPRGIALVGPPGNGKTLLARALANEAKVKFFNVNITDIMSSFINKSSQGVNQVFEDARKDGGGVIFFDEFDSLAPTRKSIHTHQEDRKVVGVLNRQMDGFTQSDRIVVFVATNRIEDIDSAVLRPGRIDRIIDVKLPDEEGREEIFAVHCRRAEREARRTLFDALDVSRINKKMAEFSGADIAEVIRRVLEAKVIEEDGGTTPGMVTTEEILRELDAYERVVEGTRKIGFSAQSGFAFGGK